MTRLVIIQLAMVASLYLLIGLLTFPFKLDPDSSELRNRFGTVLSHSSDQNGVYQAAYQDPKAVDHVYCYYPKGTADSSLILVRKDDGNCSKYLGEAIIRESSWVSEVEKLWQ